MNIAFLYGFADASEMYRPVRYEKIDMGFTKVADIKLMADELRMRNPNIKSIYLVSQRPGLAWDFQTAMRHPNTETCITFKDYVEQIGIKIF